MNIGDFTVAAVTSEASVPLSGYTGRDKLEWKGRYDVVNRQKPQEAARIDKKPKVEEIMPEIPELVMPSIPVVPPAPIKAPELNIPLAPIKEPELNIPPAPIKAPELNVPLQPIKEPELNIPPAPIKAPEMNIPPAPIKAPEMNVPLQPIKAPEMNVPLQPIKEPEPNIPPAPIKAPEPNIPPIEVVIPAPVETHIIENKVEIEILMPKCPPMAPLEEPCEMEMKEEERPKCEDIKEFYCDDDSDSDSDSDSDDDHKKHHERPISPYYSGSMYSRLKKVLRRLRRCEPFERERGYEWFKVGDDIYDINEVAVPYMGYMMPMGYPFMSEGCSMMMDRKDYIIGVKYEDKDEDDRRLIKHLLYGVPAIFSKKNEQYYRSRGFMEFIPHKSKSYGYFIMCLDIGKGTMCHME
jgi:hypothetical protein